MGWNRLVMPELLILNYSDPGRLTAILTTAPVLAASSFRDMQGIRIIPAIPTRASASIVQ